MCRLRGVRLLLGGLVLCSLRVLMSFQPFLTLLSLSSRLFPARLLHLGNCLLRSPTPALQHEIQILQDLHWLLLGGQNQNQPLHRS